MVHALVRPAFHAPRDQRGLWFEQRPSPARITALSGVIALHAAAFVLLMMPMRAYDPAPTPPDIVIVDDFKRIPKKVIPIAPPKDPPKTVPRTPTRILAPTPPQPPIVIDEGPEIAPPLGPVIDDVPIAPIVAPGPVSLERLEYASAPPPPYPPEAARRRIEGTVYLRVLVDVDGKPLEVLVQTSSGHRALDDAARKFVLAKWRFRPAMEGDVAVQAVGIVPIRFAMR